MKILEGHQQPEQTCPYETLLYKWVAYSLGAQPSSIRRALFDGEWHLEVAVVRSRQLLASLRFYQTILWMLWLTDILPSNFWQFSDIFSFQKCSHYDRNSFWLSSYHIFANLRLTKKKCPTENSAAFQHLCKGTNTRLLLAPQQNAVKQRLADWHHCVLSSLFLSDGWRQVQERKVPQRQETPLLHGASKSWRPWHLLQLSPTHCSTAFKAPHEN